MAVTRQLVIGIDPILGVDNSQNTWPVANTYSWASVPDQNSGAKSISTAFVPRTKGTNIYPWQDTILLGTVGASIMMQAFRNDLALDNGSASTGTLITNRIDPTRIDDEPPDWKRFLGIEFPGANPMALGCTIQFCKDIDDPLNSGVTWTSLTFSSTDIRTFIPSGLARWIHLKFIDTSSQALRAIFDGFILHYIKLGSREDE